MRYAFRPMSARPWLAVLEALCLVMLCWLGLLLLHEHLSFLWEMLVSLQAGIAAVSLCALRLQPKPGSWRRQGIFDLLPAALLGLILSGLELLFTLLLLRFSPTVGPLWRDGHRPLLVALIALCLNLACFSTSRVSIRFAIQGHRLRRTRLFWSLTFTQAMAGAAGIGLLMLMLEAVVISQTLDSFTSVFTALGLILLGVFLLGALVLPFALASSLFVRQMTRRLNTLASATSTLRGGDYTTRVQVVGEDEIARLQVDFNAMATELETKVKELQKERDTVAALLQSRRELLATVSHELRTPMATLRSYLETTLIHWDEREPAMVRADLQIMENEAVHLQGLVDDLFALARTEVGKLSLHIKPTEIAELLTQVVEVVTPLAWQTRRIEVAAEVPPDLPTVQVDAGRLIQAVHNLLHNAIRHTSPGGIVAVTARAEGQFVVIQVRDTGEGISPEELSRIWERFYQGEQQGHLRESGTGLGLALVKEWIEAMGGTVAVESVVGQGSCFTLIFPRAATRRG